MRILGAAPRVPNPKEAIPTSLRLSNAAMNNSSPSTASSASIFLPEFSSSAFSAGQSTTCFNVWRTRNADDDDERIALAAWARPPSSPSSSQSSSSSSHHDPDSFHQAKQWATVSPSSATSQSLACSSPMEPWLTAILLVDFNQDSGPLLDTCIPPNALTHAERDTVCHHAMPDSATMSSVSVCEDVLFSFRVPRRLNKAEERKGSISVASTRLLFAHTLFRQAPDQSKRRGALQKSLVLITSTPFVGLPALLLAILAPKAFVYGRPVLEHAAQDIDAWPDPRRSPSVLQTDVESNEVKRSISSTTTLLPIVDDLVSIEWTDAFLTSFAAPKAKLYKPQSITNPKSNTNSNNSKRPTNINLGLNFNNLPFSTNHTSTSLISPSTSISCFEQRKELEEQQRNDDHAVWDVSRRCSHAGATRPTVIRMWELCKPTLHRGAPIFHEINPVLALASVIELLPAIWEVLVIGEPLLVVGNNPTACSAAVMALLSLLHPLPFIGDWRPYLCIQDPDYERIISSRNVQDLFPDGAIFGITNRHMVGTMKFPHVLYLSPANAQNITISSAAGTGSVMRGRLTSPSRPTLQRSRTVRQVATRAIVAHLRGDKKAEAESVRAFRLCVYDRMTRPFLRIFERYVVPTSLISSNSSSSSSSSSSTFANHLNQQHPFLRSANKKHGTVEPYALDPFDRPLRLTPFVATSFPTTDDMNAPRVSALFRRGASSAWKGRVRAMYQRFIQGPVFREWWHEELMVAERRCVSQHRDQLIEACSRGSAVICHALRARSSHQMECLDLIVDLATRVRREFRKVSAEEDQVLHEALKRELNYLIEGLPQHKKSLFEASVY